MSLGKYSCAIEDFDRAIEFRPDDAAQFYYRAWMYSNLGDYRSAIADFDRAIRLDPGLWQALMGRGWAYLMLGNFERAMEDRRRAAEIQARQGQDAPQPQPRQNDYEGVELRQPTGETSA